MYSNYICIYKMGGEISRRVLKSQHLFLILSHFGGGQEEEKHVDPYSVPHFDFELILEQLPWWSMTRQGEGPPTTRCATP